MPALDLCKAGQSRKRTPQKRSPPAVLRACECLRSAGTGKKKSGAHFGACL
ncbi:hypothetical protein I6H54_15345 [Delftia acidovorans]|nr:hypothetical protein I6H54_15345 [Delftia acidovorans]